MKKISEATLEDLVEGNEFALSGGGVAFIEVDDWTGSVNIDWCDLPREDLYSLAEKMKTFKFPVDS